MALDDELKAQILRYHFVEHWRVGIPSPPSSGSITPPSSGCWARQGWSASASARVAPRSSTPTWQFITETLERFPTLDRRTAVRHGQGAGLHGRSRPLPSPHRAAAFRAVPREAYLRLRTLAGEQAQVDWAHCSESSHIGRADSRP